MVVGIVEGEEDAEGVRISTTEVDLEVFSTRVIRQHQLRRLLIYPPQNMGPTVQSTGTARNTINTKEASNNLRGVTIDNEFYEYHEVQSCILGVEGNVSTININGSSP